jgi:hypothetical protein
LSKLIWGLKRMYQVYVKKKIATSLLAAEEGKVISHDDVKKRLMTK